ncbi:MAG: tRNA glutamyl-Q(34) synthetase GluQRS [Actinomycetota bacterium]
MSGRFAPSPTGRLHVGNLRTAVIGWLAARSEGRGHIVRMEDLDRINSSPEHEQQQLDDLTALGIDWDGEVIRQSERFDRYEAAIDRLTELGLTYECFCSRRDIRAEVEESPRAPHLPVDAYPGTCRRLTDAARRRRRDEGRPAALRLLAGSASDPDEVEQIEFVDAVHGTVAFAVDDLALRRNDGVPSYQVAVVVDDAAQGVTQVVRADDLLHSTPRQIHLQRLLGLPTPSYGHVPLVVGDDGERLAKRHGAVTLGDLADAGVGPADVLAWIARSLGLDVGLVLDDAIRPSAEALLDGFRLAGVPLEPVDATELIRLDPHRSSRQAQRPGKDPGTLHPD